MATKTRSGVFETNSSSVHNFTIDPDCDDSNVTKDEAKRDVESYNGIYASDGDVFYDKEKGILDFSVLPPDAMSFGREYTRIVGFFGKVLYALAAFNVEDDYASIDSMMAFLKEYLDLKEIKCPKEDKEIWDKNENVTYSIGYGLGSIDHQSVGYFQSFLSNMSITAKDFVLGKKYAVTTTCDG